MIDVVKSILNLPFWPLNYLLSWLVGGVGVGGGGPPGVGPVGLGPPGVGPLGAGVLGGAAVVAGAGAGRDRRRFLQGTAAVKHDAITDRSTIKTKIV